MELLIGLNSALSVSAVIEEVETGYGTEVRLVVQCGDDEEIEILTGLDVRDEEVEARSTG